MQMLLNLYQPISHSMEYKRLIIVRVIFSDEFNNDGDGLCDR